MEGWAIVTTEGECQETQNAIHYDIPFELRIIGMMHRRMGKYHHDNVSPEPARH